MYQEPTTMNPIFESQELSSTPALNLPAQNTPSQEDETIGMDYVVLKSEISKDAQAMEQEPVNTLTSKQQDVISKKAVERPCSKTKGSISLKRFSQKSAPELEPEPIPFAFADVRDIMDRDALTLDKDLLAVLARCA
jgi:hypothetical protein